MAEIKESVHAPVLLMMLGIFSNSVRKNLIEILNDAANDGYDRVFARTPVVTGRLQSSTGSRVDEANFTAEFGWINDPPDYSQYVENGNTRGAPAQQIVSTVGEEIRSEYASRFDKLSARYSRLAAAGGAGGAAAADGDDE